MAEAERSAMIILARDGRRRQMKTRKKGWKVSEKKMEGEGTAASDGGSLGESGEPAKAYAFPRVAG